MNNEATQELEIRILLDVLQQRYGYDFHHYADSSLKRRIVHCLSAFSLQYVSEMIPRILYEDHFLNQFIHELTVGVTSMFRDPTLYPLLRHRVIPDLMTYSSLNIWHAGCSTGEEVYAMAIFLQEAGLYERARLYATDLDGHSLAHAETGCYPANKMVEYAENYRQAGGLRALSDYCVTTDHGMQMDGALKKNMVFSTHNLATDSRFADMHLIFCRNVLIYFDQPLQDRVVDIFWQSLVRGGLLCLGHQESLSLSKGEELFELVVAEARIYRKRPVPGARG